MDFIDLKGQYRLYREDIDRAIQNNLDNATFIMGADNKKLEESLAAYVGVKHGICVASGTDALLAPLMAYGIKAGDEIITTPFTFIATSEVIAFMGAKPVFVDIDERNYNLSIGDIESKITPRTRGIIPVSLYGQVPDMDKINAIAKKHNLFVMEDAAQSFGAIYRGRKSCSLSEVSATSFFPSKPLGCYGDGGMVFTDNDELAEKIRSLANHGQSERYVHRYVGLNLRLDTIQCGILLAKFKHFEEEAQKRYEIGRRYTELLKGSSVVTPHLEDYTDRSVFAQYSIRVKNRDEVVKHLSASQIPTAVHYPIPIHMQPAYQYLGYREGDFPIAERVSREIMSIPMHPFLSEDEQHMVTDRIKEVAQ